MYKIVSLFSGCGGLDLGFLGNFYYLNDFYYPLPFEIVFATDIDQKACDTYRYNFKHNIICQDINNIKISEIPDCDLLIGGFPCQDFSLSGKRKGFESARGNLYKNLLTIVKEKQPKVFVAENVEGLTKKIGDYCPIDIIIQQIKEIGYNPYYSLFNTADFKVPQIRKRVIIVGIRKDIDNSLFSFPKPNCKQWITAKQAIDDLWNELGNNTFANHSLKDYSKAKFYQNAKMQGNRKILVDKPSVTIRAEHHGNIEGHYRNIDGTISDDISKWRRLSVRECARIQSFPDNFVFPCSASIAYKQIGNAVPPVFAWNIAQSVLVFLNQNLKDVEAKKLLSY